MIIFSCLKKEFNDYVKKGIISNKIYEAYKNMLGRKTKLNQIKSWANSLPFLNEVIKDLPDNVGITIEYNIPLTSKYVDVILSGYDQDMRPNIILIELKQWEYATMVKNLDGVVNTLIDSKEKNTLHPSYQVNSYAELILNYNINVQNYKINVSSLVYLHNYNLYLCDDLYNKKYSIYYRKSLMFGKNDKLELKKKLESLLFLGDNLDIIKLIDKSEIRPTKKLLNSLTNIIQGKKEFTIYDEQKIILEEIINLVQTSYIEHKKQVVIIEGGPGSGKSILAINLLGELLTKGLMGAYVSKNMAPRKVYKSKLICDNNEVSINELFKSSGSFFRDKENKYDFLLVDEAHRLQEKSGVHNNVGENQIKEIINASKISIFFVDENQIITLKDIGRISNIKYYAKYFNAEIKELKLTSQYRCNGSNSYINFVNNLLDNKRGKFYANFDFKVMDSLLELKNEIMCKNTNNNARLVAGFCWPRNAKEADNQEYKDIKIDDFEMSWNLKHGEPFATRLNAINEVGCVHNVQGLEFDYIGVIIGPDLKYQNGKVISNYKARANTEKSLYGLHVLMKKDKEYYENLADKIIKNTYRVLLTRGIKGCYVYACDKNLQEHLKKLSLNNSFKQFIN